MEELNQLGPMQSRDPMDAHRHPRFKIDVDIRVYPRDCPVVRGRTVDISESGISAMLRVEVPLGEVVRLEFTLPLGDVEILAMVRQRIAFRSWIPVHRRHFGRRRDRGHLPTAFCGTICRAS